jgi:hypothetical protein
MPEIELTGVWSPPLHLLSASELIHRGTGPYYSRVQRIRSALAAATTTQAPATSHLPFSPLDSPQPTTTTHASVLSASARRSSLVSGHLSHPSYAMPSDLPPLTYSGSSLCRTPTPNVEAAPYSHSCDPRLREREDKDAKISVQILDRKVSECRDEAEFAQPRDNRSKRPSGRIVGWPRGARLPPRVVPFHKRGASVA